MVRLVGVFYEVAEDPLDAASVQKVRQAVVAGYEGELLVGVGQFLECDGDEGGKALNGGEGVIEVQCRVVSICDGSPVMSAMVLLWSFVSSRKAAETRFMFIV